MFIRLCSLFCANEYSPSVSNKKKYCFQINKEISSLSLLCIGFTNVHSILFMSHGTHIGHCSIEGSNYFCMVPLCGTGNLTTFIHGLKIGCMKNGPWKSLRISGILDLEDRRDSELHPLMLRLRNWDIERSTQGHLAILWDQAIYNLLL